MPKCALQCQIYYNLYTKKCKKILRIEKIKSLKVLKIQKKKKKWNFVVIDTDDRKPSKRQVSFISLVFVVKCICKSGVINT